jgi:hypothetical protein
MISSSAETGSSRSDVALGLLGRDAMRGSLARLLLGVGPPALEFFLADDLGEVISRSMAVAALFG